MDNSPNPMPSMNPQTTSPSMVVNTSDSKKNGFKKNIWILFILLFITVLGIVAVLSYFNFIIFLNPFSSFKEKTSYEGSWELPGQPPIPTKLTIVSLTNNAATILYQSGINTNGYQDNYQIKNVKIEKNGKILTWGGEDESTHFNFQLNLMGNLSGERISKTEHYTIIMHPSVFDPLSAPLPQLAVSNLEPCRLNNRFKPIDPQGSPFGSLLQEKVVSPSISPFVGAYQGFIEGDTRLVVFPSGRLQYVVDAMLSDDDAFRSGLFSNNQFSWYTVFDGQLGFSYNAVRAGNTLKIHVIKYLAGKEFDAVFTPCSVI